LGYIGIVQHREHSPEVLSIPPGTPCVYIYIYIHYMYMDQHKPVCNLFNLSEETDSWSTVIPRV